MGPALFSRSSISSGGGKFSVRRIEPMVFIRSFTHSECIVVISGSSSSLDFARSRLLRGSDLGPGLDLVRTPGRGNAFGERHVLLPVLEACWSCSWMPIDWRPFTCSPKLVGDEPL